MQITKQKKTFGKNKIYNDAIDLLEISIAYINLKTNQVWISKYLRKFLGYRNSEITITIDKFFSYIHNDYLNNLLFNITKNRNKIFEDILLIKTKNGDYKLFNIKFNKQNSENILLIFSKNKDHSLKNKEIEITELQNEDGLFKSIIECSSIGYWDWYIKDNYRFMSSSFKSMFGYTDQELPNTTKAWKKIVHPDDFKLLMSNLDKHVKTKGKFLFNNTIRYIHKNGKIVWVFCRGKVIEWDSKGNPLRMVGSNVDITDLKNTENLEKLVKTRTEELETLNKELEAFSYSVSHDLKAPLRALEGFSKILYEKYDSIIDENGKRWLNYINNNARKMDILINDMLSFTKINRTNINKTNVNSNKLVEEIIEENKRLYKDKNIVINIDDIPDCYADISSLRQVWQNLISNAIKYSSKNKKILIDIKGFEDEQNTHYSIKDNGVGFNEKYKDKLFLAFQRCHKNTEFEGSGIGLAITAKVIYKHGGCIFAESEINKGAKFTFILPKKQNEIGEFYE